MKKILLAALLTAALLISPWIVGISAEGALGDYASSLNAMPGYSASVEEYDQGYLRSRAKLRIKLAQAAPGADSGDADMQAFMRRMREGVLLDLDIAHGPLVLRPAPALALYRADIRLAETGGEAPGGLAALGLRGSLDMGLTGSGSLLVSAPPFELDEGTGVFFSYGGMEFVNRFSGYGARFETEGEIRNISFAEEGQRVSIAPIRFTGQGDFSRGLWLSPASWKADIASMQLTGPEVNMRLENLVMEGALTESAPERLDMRYGLSIQSLNDTDFTAPLHELEASFAVDGLDRQVLLTLYETLGGLEEGLSEEEISLRVQPLMRGIFPAGPNLRIERLGFRMGEDMQFKASAALGFSDALLGDPAALGNPLAALSSLSANAEFSPALLSLAMEAYVREQYAAMGLGPMDVELALAQQKPQFEATFAQLVQAGYLNFENGLYSLSAALEQGQFLLNGNPLPMAF